MLDHPAQIFGCLGQDRDHRLLASHRGCLDVIDEDVQQGLGVPGDEVVEGSEVVHFHQGARPGAPREDPPVGCDSLSDAFGEHEVSRSSVKVQG